MLSCRGISSPGDGLLRPHLLLAVVDFESPASCSNHRRCVRITAVVFESSPLSSSCRCCCSSRPSSLSPRLSASSCSSRLLLAAVDFEYVVVMSYVSSLLGLTPRRWILISWLGPICCLVGEFQARAMGSFALIFYLLWLTSNRPRHVRIVVARCWVPPSLPSVVGLCPSSSDPAIRRWVYVWRDWGKRTR